MKDMKGLTQFIADIRNCKSPEAELKRINKELANIRSKFGVKASKLDGYAKKKYVSKLLFIFLLGHDLEFGHTEAVNLMSVEKFSEKQIGYLFVSVVISDSHDMGELIAQAISIDLRSTKELHVCLALNCIANMGGKVLSETVAPQVKKLLTAKEAPNFVRKKAALALLRLFRAAPFEVDQEFALQVFECIFHEDKGLVMSVTSLIIAMAIYRPDLWTACVPTAIEGLKLINLMSDPERCGHPGVLSPDSEYVYYNVPAPWLSVKLLRLLQLFPETEDAGYKTTLDDVLSLILERSNKSLEGKVKLQFKNANNGVFFEAVQLIAHYDSNETHQLAATQICGAMFSTMKNDANLQFLSLDGLSQLAVTRYARAGVKEHIDDILETLNAPVDPDSQRVDTSIQRRAVDVLYGGCDSSNVVLIVKELLKFLKTSDYSIREEVVLKCAILAEKFASDYKWYVNVVLTLITLAGDHVAEEVWHRVLQIVVNREDVQSHAARVTFSAMLDPAAHENLVKVGTYVLGEFGHLIANDPSSTAAKQLELLQTHYPMTSIETRSLILTTYAKFTNIFPELKTSIQDIFRQDHIFKSTSHEIQQRANEYFHLTTVSNAAVMTAVLEEMPMYPEDTTSLLSKLDKSADVTDRIAKSKGVALTGLNGEAVDTGEVDEANVQRNGAFLDGFRSADKGTLFDSPVLQVLAQVEVVKDKATLTLYYGNKAEVDFTGVSCSLIMAAEEESCVNLTAQELPPSLQQGQQVPQKCEVEIQSAYTTLPVLDVRLSYQGKPIVLKLQLPIPTNRFYATHPTFPWDSATFMARWGSFADGEVVETVEDLPDFTPGDVIKALTDHKLTVMPGIDPKETNMCCAAILNMGAPVGVVVRVQTDSEKHMIVYTVRASAPTAPGVVAKLLQNLM